MPSSSTASSPVSTPAGHMSPPLTRTVLVGIAAGFLSGLFGVGGGILIVPALVMVLKFDQRLAHGTSLAAVLPIAVSSLVSYATSGEIDWTVGLFLAIGAVAGAVIGTHILHKLPHDTLAIVFSVVLLVTAIRLIIDNSDSTGRGEMTLVMALVLIVAGVATGVLAGLLGVGGGVIMVPIMVVGVGLPAALAKGTSVAVIIPTAIMGTWRNRTKKNVDLRSAMIVGVAGIVSAFVAGKISVGMSEQLSNVLFALLLFFVAGRMVWQLVSERRAGTAAH